MSRCRFLGLSLLAMLVLRPAFAQDMDHEHMDHEHMDHAHADVAAPVAVPDVVDLELRRNGSGTAWQPETTPHNAMHTQAGGFDLMFHALLFGGWDRQGGPRGAEEPIGIGWLMGMASRRFGRGRLLARAMLSPEPWTVGYRAGGYPLLLQTGETFGGQPLHDRQHAHDLFMELGAVYTQGLTDEIALQLYLAPAGEPALGPVAFPHRTSASSDPLAAIAHHWQDSSHISFGVLTAGVILGGAKLEASWFNGREPDEDRLDIDLRRPDSYAFRVSMVPTPSWSLQASYGRLASPEALRPDEAVKRVTASAMVDTTLGRHGHWATTAVFGANKAGISPLASSFLIETNADLDAVNVIFGRIEIVQKERSDLDLDFNGTPAGTVTVSSFNLGYLRNFGRVAGFLPGIGARGTVGLVPTDVSFFYGSNPLLGGAVYLRVAVAPMSHADH